MSNIEKLQISEANLIQENEKNETKINALENQVKLLSEKYEKLKVKHVNLLQTLLAKENQIQSLNLKIINEREPNISNGLQAGEVMHSECVSLQNVSIDQLNLKKNLILNLKMQFFLLIQTLMDAKMPDEWEEHEFTAEESKILNSLSMLRRSDAPFVRKLLEFLYKHDISALEHRSYSGQTRKRDESKDVGPIFKAITPEKKAIIHQQFSSRIRNANLSSQEKLERMDTKYVSKLIAWGIGAIRRNVPSVVE